MLERERGDSTISSGGTVDPHNYIVAAAKRRLKKHASPLSPTHHLSRLLALHWRRINGTATGMVRHYCIHKSKPPFDCLNVVCRSTPSSKARVYYDRTIITRRSPSSNVKQGDAQWSPCSNSTALMDGYHRPHRGRHGAGHRTKRRTRARTSDVHRLTGERDGYQISRHRGMPKQMRCASEIGP